MTRLVASADGVIRGKNGSALGGGYAILDNTEERVPVINIFRGEIRSGTLLILVEIGDKWLVETVDGE